MNRILFFSIIFLMLAYGICWPTIINIPADYPTIQQGIDASVDGDTVLVQPGTYTGNGNRDLDFWSKSIHLKSAAGPEMTVIDCQGSFVSPHRGFIFQMNEDSTSIIEGFTITEGFQYGRGAGIYCSNGSPKIINCHFMYNETHGSGGAIYCESDNPIVIRQCTFYENYAGDKGGGIYFVFSRGSITDCLIRDNSGIYGGGIACSASDSLFFYECVIQRNGVPIWSEMGGGLYCMNSSPVFIGCTFIENSSTYGGAAFIILDSNPIFMDCLFQYNSAEWGFSGGGIAAFECTTLTLINCVVSSNSSPGGNGGGLASGLSEILIINTTVSDNSASEGGGISAWESGVKFYNSAIIRNTVTEYNCRGGGISLEYNSRSDLANCILWDNYASNIPDGIYTDTSSIVSASYSDIQAGWPGVGNINAEPLFRDPNHGDFHLMSIACGDSADSPCIDAGDPNILDSLLDCSWGLGGPRSDMGAYGGGDSAIVGILENMPSLPDRFILLQNYPNPFNARATIRFVLPKSQDVDLAIYDLLGRQVETIIDEYKQAGVHTVTFNASRLSSGVYFYRLQAGDIVETKRMVLLK
jgi:predicted outer membrane repeat protein